MIVELEKLVTSKEMSEKIKQVGFEMETPFRWYTDKFLGLTVGCDSVTAHKAKDSLRAYTFQQLWDVLPAEIICKGGHLRGDTFFLTMTVPVIEYINFEGIGIIGADARIYLESHTPDKITELLLWCIKEGYFEELTRSC